MAKTKKNYLHQANLSKGLALWLVEAADRQGASSQSLFYSFHLQPATVNKAQLSCLSFAVIILRGMIFVGNFFRIVGIRLT